MDKYIIVAIPALNEEVAIGSVVLRSFKYARRVVVIDDGSSDLTAETARLAGADVLSHRANLGKGRCIKDAFEYARKCDADILILIDGDGQHTPEDIPKLVEPILNGEADLVNGSKFISGCKTVSKIPLYRRIGQEVLTLCTNVGMCRRITDTQNGFRAFSRKTFHCFSFAQRGMAIESEMLLDAARCGLRIKEVPIKVRYDVDGSTYNPLVHGISVLVIVLGLIVHKRKDVQGKRTTDNVVGACDE